MLAFQTRDAQVEAIAMMLLAELRQDAFATQLYVESLANMLAVHLNDRSDSERARFLATPGEERAVFSVVKSELFYGAFWSNKPHAYDSTRTLERQHAFLSRFVSLPLEDEAALLTGQIRAKLANAGTPIGSDDLQIAAITPANLD